jgi:Zn-dependent protease
LNDIQVSERLINFLIFLPLFFISLSVHEFAHAYLANKLGDSTAKNLGRLTLNPLKHIDLVGSVLMPVIAFASGLMIIGWAKPVPVNPNNFKKPYSDDAVVSVAGPISNLALAFLFAVILFFNNTINTDSWLNGILTLAVYFNIFLFAFNLLPIPPLDGSHILFDLFPNRLTAKILNLGFYGTIILFLFIYSPLWKYFMTFVLGITEFILNTV